MKALSWQAVVLLISVILIVAGISVWLVAAHLAPAALLVAPLTTLLASAGAYLAGYFQRAPADAELMRHLMPEGTKLVPTMSPPPLVQGGTTVTVQSPPDVPLDVEVSDASKS